MNRRLLQYAIDAVVKNEVARLCGGGQSCARTVVGGGAICLEERGRMTWYVQFPPEEFASANDSLPLRIPTIHDISFATIVHSLAAIHAASGFTHASTVKSPIESNVLLSVALKY